MGKIADEIYEDLVKKAGLYGKAFFGHRATRQEKRRLEKLHKQALMSEEKELAKRAANQQRLERILAADKARRVHRAVEDEGNPVSGDQVSQAEESAS